MATTVSESDVVKMISSLSNWGRWGADDQLGTMNLITPAKRKRAAALVQDGVPVSCARPIVTNGISADTTIQPLRFMVDSGEGRDHDQLKHLEGVEKLGREVGQREARDLPRRARPRVEVAHVFQPRQEHHGEEPARGGDVQPAQQKRGRPAAEAEDFVSEHRAENLPHRPAEGDGQEC